VPGEAIVFAAFGKITAEKRVTAILDALEALNREGRNAYLMLVGDGTDYPELADEITRRGLAGCVRVTGHVPDDAVAAYLAAADACLCLRWPTALETSASWLRCLAAGRPTVITDLAHLADTPPDVALRVDLADEAGTLQEAMRRLADDRKLRRQLELKGQAHWAAHHTLEAMAEDYRRVLTLAVSRAAPQPEDLPSHFLTDHSEPARSILRRFQLPEDVVQPAVRRLMR
jgi:glycosyltransferase involved in cell wall biosynthesis